MKIKTKIHFRETKHGTYFQGFVDNLSRGDTICDCIVNLEIKDMVQLPVEYEYKDANEVLIKEFGESSDSMALSKVYDEINSVLDKLRYDKKFVWELKYLYDTYQYVLADTVLFELKCKIEEYEK